VAPNVGDRVVFESIARLCVLELAARYDQTSWNELLLASVVLSLWVRREFQQAKSAPDVLSALRNATNAANAANATI
jgi:hypothetical protein